MGPACVGAGDLNWNHLCPAGRNLDLVGRERKRKIRFTRVADGKAIDEVRAAAAEKILEGDINLCDPGLGMVKSTIGSLLPGRSSPLASCSPVGFLS